MSENQEKHKDSKCCDENCTNDVTQEAAHASSCSDKTETDCETSKKSNQGECENQANPCESEAEKSQEDALDLSKKIEELEAQCKDWQNQYLRKAADFENYRKRMIREKQEAIDYANSNLLLDLVQVLDDFDRAIDAGKNQGGETVNNAFAEGVVMIKNQMISMLSSKYALTYYPAKGELFDPNIHEAVSMIQSPDVKEAVVGEELQKGYRLKERVIRHAKVMVLMPAEKQDEKEAEESEAADKTNEK